MSKKKKPRKPKRKLTAAEKAARKKRRAEYMTVFVNGKQKRVKRPTTIDGVPVEDWIRDNADPIWLHQHGYHDVLYERELEEQERRKLGEEGDSPGVCENEDIDIPF